MRVWKVSLLAGILALVTAFPATAGTLDDAQKRSFVTCGVSDGLPGFSEKSEGGTWSGFDVDTCRAIAAAVLGDSEKVKFLPLTPKERFPALQSGEVDVLVRNTTWTLLRDTALKLNFAGVNYYDGQGFMVRADLGLKSARELTGAAVCVATGTTTALNLADFSEAEDLQMRAINFDTASKAANAYQGGRCDAFTSDLSTLAAFRVTFERPADHVLLPDVISKEPLGPVVRHGDDQWLDIVRWSLYALLQAEELGVTSKNVDGMRHSKLPIVRRLLGASGHMGENLGLDNDWAFRIIKQVGNYSEIYERNVGPSSPLRIPRGINALWTDGGIQYPMPIR